MDKKANQFNKKSDQLNIRAVLRYYLRFWYIIALSGLIFATVSYLNLNSKNKIYRSSANVLVKDQKNSGVASELDIFSDLGISRNQSNISNEILLLTSRPLIKEVVRSLDLNIDIYQKQGMFTPTKHYYGKNQPFNVDLSQCDSMLETRGVSLQVVFKKNDAFDVNQIINEEIRKIGRYSFNQAFNTPIGPITIKANNLASSKPENTYFVSISNLKSATSNYKSAFNASPVNRDATVLDLTITGKIPEKNEDFINRLIKQHEQQAVQDKNEITRHTSEFIAERMKVIEEELSDVESESENFKTKNELISVEMDAEKYSEKESTIEREIMTTSIERSLVEFMENYLSEHEGANYLLPANLGFSDGGINTMTSEYNKLVMERNKVVESSSEDNPIAVKLKTQIKSLQSNLENSLNNLQESVIIRLRELQAKEREYKQKLDNIPEYERKYREIARQQQIKETLYLYLLQKREENEIAMASTVGSVKVVEHAFTSNTPIAPQRRSALITSFLLGILIPVGYLFVKDKLDNKVHTREDLEETRIPVVAEIPKNKTKKYMVVQQGERSLVAEAFRMLRSNMNFLLPKNKEGGNVIFISSAIAGEGKTFNAINLANSLAMIDKKVVLVGMDLRAPKITRYLDIEDGKGVTNYLVDNKLTIEDITSQSSVFENLDYIISGDVPPNPSELLMRPRVDELFAQLRKEYDYIIVDNAPTTLVVDAMSIVQHSDLFLYVVRANYLDKKLLDDIVIMKEDEKVKNLAFILNDVDLKHSPYKGYGYGNRYGYGYGSGYVYGDEQKKPFWRRVFRG